MDKVHAGIVAVFQLPEDALIKNEQATHRHA
jgi:hypothetical protein